MKTLRGAPTPLLALVLFLVLGVPDPATAQSAAATAESTSLVLPPHRGPLQTALNRLLARDPYRGLVQNGRLSVALVDLTDPAAIRWAALDEDHMRYAASLPKIAILLTVFEEIEAGRLEYTPEVKRQAEAMIRVSSNREASNLIERVGFPAIERTLRDPRYELYDPARQGGLWVGRGYGGLGLWRRDPLSSISHGATARQVARFFVMLERGMLVSPWASLEMKEILSDPAIHHKFVRGLEEARPRSRIFRKSGTWRQWHSDAAIVERDGRRYVAVALLESQRASGILTELIVDLDEIIFSTPVPRRTDRP